MKKHVVGWNPEKMEWTHMCIHDFGPWERHPYITDMVIHRCTLCPLNEVRVEPPKPRGNDSIQPIYRTPQRYMDVDEYGDEVDTMAPY